MLKLIRNGKLHILINKEEPKKLTEIEKLRKLAEDLKRGER